MPRKTMVEYIEKKAMQLCILSGMRYLECIKFVLDVAGESRCIHNDHPGSTGDALNGIVELDVEVNRDYAEYDRKMRKAGLKDEYRSQRVNYEDFERTDSGSGEGVR